MLNTNQFTKVEKTLVSEASTLFGKQRMPIEFELQSAKTGNVEIFRHADTEWNLAEGEVLSWSYIPKNAALAGKIGIQIFND